MTGEELALAREKQRHRTAALGIVAGLLAALALCATMIDGCREMSRCPSLHTMQGVCGVPATPDCIAAVRKACR